MKKLFFWLPFLFLAALTKAQTYNCTFKPPVITINFGSGDVPDLNTEGPDYYRRVGRYCPTDGHYSYTSFTSDCFRGDWHTMLEDHTAGDANGNMMLVNASPYSGTFLMTTILGLKAGTVYEFGAWMLNVCKPTDKCPFPLLPVIAIVLQTADGKTVMQYTTGELARRESPEWAQYKVMFTAPATVSGLTLTMMDINPGGCGNDFALDDITFRECIIVPPVVTAVKKPVPVKQPPKKEVPPVVAKKQPAPPVIVKQPPPPPVVVKQTPPPPPVIAKQTPPPVVVKPKPVPPKPVAKKEIPAPEKKQPPVAIVAKPQPVPLRDSTPVAKPKMPVFPPPPPLLTTRTNALIKQFETEAGQIEVNLYDNGEIDGDTISIFHNNVLVVAHARLSIKPITFTITLDAAHPHHELVMVAENLGSIPPNTSLMVITAGTKRYEVYISSTEQKNAKVIFDLKE